MEDLTARQLESYKATIDLATAVRETLKSKGWKVLKEKIDDRITDKRNGWLKAQTPEAAEIIRLRASAYNEIFEIAKKVLLDGENAQRILTQNPNIKLG
jgi:hypothetical protein